MSDIATPTEATRTGPPPANVPRVTKPQPCDVETHSADRDVNDGEDQPLLNMGKLSSTQFNIACFNSSTATDSTSPSTVQPGSVVGGERDDDAGLSPVVPLAGPNAPTAKYVVSVPLAQFQQLVELLAEAVREIKSTRQIQPDPEQGNTNITRKRGGSNKCYSYCNFPHDQYPKEEEMRYRKKAIDEIWNSVEPWDMARLSEIPEEPVRYPGQVNYREYRSWEHSHWKDERDILIANKIWIMYDYLTGSTTGSNILDIDCLLSSSVASILSGGKSLLGDILLDCYQSEAPNRRNGLQSGRNDYENLSRYSSCVANKR